MRLAEKSRLNAEAQEADLVRRAQADDTDAFAELYRRFREKIFWVAKERLGDLHAAEEVVQETFARAFVAIKRVDPARPFGSWLGAIALNLIVDIKRALWRSIPTAHADQIVQPGASDETLERVLSAEGIQIVKRALLLIPARPRRILIATVFGGLSPAEIADLERTSESGVTSALYRARRVLRRSLRRLVTAFAVMRIIPQALTAG